jgi:hypothetical protein
MGEVVAFMFMVAIDASVLGQPEMWNSTCRPAQGIVINKNLNNRISSEIAEICNRLLTRPALAGNSYWTETRWLLCVVLGMKQERMYPRVRFILEIDLPFLTSPELTPRIIYPPKITVNGSYISSQDVILLSRLQI